MRTTLAKWVLIAVVVSAAARAGETAKEEAFTKLFDGRTLDGWTVRNEPGHGWGAVWEVIDGAIEAVQEWPEATGILLTRRTFGDFHVPARNWQKSLEEGGLERAPYRYQG